MKLAVQACLRTLLAIGSAFLMVSCNGIPPKPDPTVGAFANALVIVTDPAHLDKFEVELLKAAGGGKLDDHGIGRDPTLDSPEKRVYMFWASSWESVRPFTEAWNRTNAQIGQRNLILQVKQLTQPPACTPCPCPSCQNCVSFQCGSVTKCLKKPAVGQPLSCTKLCC